MEVLALHTCAPTVHWKTNTSCICVVEDKIFTPRVKYIDIPVYFLLEQFVNDIFVPKYESLVSYRKICAPNHVQVKLSVKVING